VFPNGNYINVKNIGIMQYVIWCLYYMATVCDYDKNNNNNGWPALLVKA